MNEPSSGAIVRIASHQAAGVAAAQPRDARAAPLRERMIGRVEASAMITTTNIGSV